MIELSDLVTDLLENASVTLRYVRIESWYGEELIADDIPVVDGSEEDSCDVLFGRMVFRVPAVDAEGVSWVPAAFADALMPLGQRVKVSLGVGVADGAIEWINRGWFLINTTSADGDSLTVECLGLMALVDEAVLKTEYQPAAGSTLGSVLRDLIEPGITVDLDDAPADRAVTSTTATWSDNRLDNVKAILDAWPAESRMSEDGFVVITPPAEDMPEEVVLNLTDGVGGTVIEATGAVSREGAFNAVIAKGQYPDNHATLAGQEIISTAFDSDPSSPYRMGGPFSPYLVPYGYASPLLTTPLQVWKAARTRLRRLRLESSRTVSVTVIPHPGIQLCDMVTLTSARLGLDMAMGTITAYTLPYLPNGGPMNLTVSLEV